MRRGGTGIPKPADLTRFVILGQARSGSTMLATALRSHPQVSMYGEVFHEFERARRVDFPGDLRVPDPKSGGLRVRRHARFYREGECGEQYLREAIFYPRTAPGACAAGFKLFYEHAAPPAAATAWRYLQNDPLVRIIHLFRTDLLGSWISLEVAQRTRIWSRSRTDITPPPIIRPFIGNVSQCVIFIRKTLRQQAAARVRFRKHHPLEVNYELDLCENYGRAIQTIQEFLRLPVEDIQPATEMQRAYQQDEILLNYDELKAAADRIMVTGSNPGGI